MTDERITTSVGLLLDDLALLDQQDGMPAIVLVRDYGERDALVAAVAREARIHEVDVVTVSSPEEAVATMPSLSASRRQAAALLLRAGTAAAWGRWLDANRDRLPSFCRFVLLFVLAEELPALAMAAPAFLSWAKGRIIERLVLREADAPTNDVADEIERMRVETGRTPRELIAAWERGEIADTYQNNVRLDVARAADGKE
jgi:hypothetical protein